MLAVRNCTIGIYRNVILVVCGGWVWEVGKLYRRLVVESDVQRCVRCDSLDGIGQYEVGIYGGP